MGRISLPHLVDTDWTIIVKKASSEVEHMNVPALLVELDIQQIPVRVDEPPRVEKVRIVPLCSYVVCCSVVCCDLIFWCCVMWCYDVVLLWCDKNWYVVIRLVVVL